MAEPFSGLTFILLLSSLNPTKIFLKSMAQPGTEYHSNMYVI